MYRFLDRISEEDIRSYIDSEHPSLLGNGGKGHDRNALYRVLYSLYGTEVLHQKKIRRLLILTLFGSELSQAAITLGLAHDRKAYDVALSVSNQSWTPGNKVVWLFATVFAIPQEFLPSREDEIRGQEVVSPFTPPPELFEYQEDLVKLLTTELNSPERRTCLVQLPTGAGKTRTVLEALTIFSNEAYEGSASTGILWLAHTEELCEQAIDSFKRVWTRSGSYDACVFRYWGDYRIDIGDTPGGFIVAGYQKTALLASKDSHGFQRLLDGVSVLVIDEAHKALAPTVRHLLETVKKQGRIHIVGLTATPGRGVKSRSENRELSHLFENNLLVAKTLGSDPISRLQSMGILAKIRHIPISSSRSYRLTDTERDTSFEWGDLSSTVLRKLSEDEKRNEVILTAVQEQVEQDRPTVVFACSVEHATKLAARFAARGYFSAAIDCRMRKSLRRRSILEFRRGTISALFNYGVLSTGFDAPNIRCVVIARPTSSVVLYSQMVGRGLRGKRVGGGEQSILIDVIDNFENFGGVGEVYDYFREFWKPVASV